jgi:N-terminal half of MaoC dehydratase
MVVEEGKIREFANATRSKNADYKNGSVSPATFLTSAILWQEPSNSPWGAAGLNWARILHGAEEFTFEGPPPAAGTELVGQARIDKTYAKEGRRGGKMTFAELVVEFRDTDGALVATSRSTVIETGDPSTESGE